MSMIWKDMMNDFFWFDSGTNKSFGMDFYLILTLSHHHNETWTASGITIWKQNAEEEGESIAEVRWLNDFLFDSFIGSYIHETENGNSCVFQVIFLVVRRIFFPTGW